MDYPTQRHITANNRASFPSLVPHNPSGHEPPPESSLDSFYQDIDFPYSVEGTNMSRQPSAYTLHGERLRAPLNGRTHNQTHQQRYAIQGQGHQNLHHLQALQNLQTIQNLQSSQGFQSQHNYTQQQQHLPASSLAPVSLSRQTMSPMMLSAPRSMYSNGGIGFDTDFGPQPILHQTSHAYGNGNGTGAPGEANIGATGLAFYERYGGAIGNGDGRTSSGTPVSAVPSEPRLDSAFAYCYDRGNGQYTRLIPADMLPELKDIPRIQNSSVGMIVLPQPMGVPPTGVASNTCPLILKQSSRNGTAQASDPIQSQIDNIVKSAPVRRPKIYCDKWVHEGVCAFTQQGCKYKHEMPFDRQTQHQLGLFHGLPAWWKKHQAELQRQRDVSEPASPTAPLSTKQSATPTAEGSGERQGWRLETVKRGTSPLSSPTPSATVSNNSPASPRLGFASGGIMSVKLSNLTRRGNGTANHPPRVEDKSSTQRVAFHPKNAKTPLTPTSACVWGPIGPPQRQVASEVEVSRCRTQNGSRNGFTLLDSFEDKFLGGDEQRA